MQAVGGQTGHGLLTEKIENQGQLFMPLDLNNQDSLELVFRS